MSSECLQYATAQNKIPPSSAACERNQSTLENMHPKSRNWLRYERDISNGNNSKQTNKKLSSLVQLLF
ncbi:hypothetical protein Y1Q_0001171 [Alligator mississippiensis]|uniref:Uncharacterized protein n=1 Tax=Alligator mississippiensis TaxID=8496 RepID=A0A151PE57_ALLMI|nr:hypothetical protein Y1Q_0001171 [Alligator mississippiensis]